MKSACYKQNVRHGFTMIELLIVVAVIGILAAIAFPQYQDSVTRAKWQDNIVAMEQVKLMVAECLHNNAGNLKLCDTELELGVILPTPRYTVQAIKLTPNSARITALGSAEVGSLNLTMTPTINSTSITWTVGGSCTKVKCGIDPG
jgi:type IV pilus assembly protein PilA